MSPDSGPEPPLLLWKTQRKNSPDISHVPVLGVCASTGTGKKPLWWDVRH